MKPSYAGLTLIELLIAITIISILFGSALPSFTDLLEKKKVDANVQRLTQTLQLSRTTAINENLKVTICPINQSLVCSSNWSSGYMSFIDKDGDRQYNDDDELLFQFYSQDEKARINWRAFGHRRSLQWLETGITNHQNGTFELCYDDDEMKSRALFLTKAGRVRFSKDTNGDGIHESSTGSAISC